MIVVKMELWPGGDKAGKRALGVIVIANDGTGTDGSGNYRFSLSHAGRYFGKRKEPWKSGKVRGFVCSLSPYRLLARCLKAAGEV